jgi:hypothetical protein
MRVTSRMERKCLQGRVGSSPRLNCCCTIGMRGFGDGGKLAPVRFPLRLRFSVFTAPGTRIYICTMYVAPTVAPLENMLVVPGGASVGDMASVPPRPLLLIALAGSDLQLLLQRRQSLGCNGSGANRGDLCAGCQGFEDRTRLQRSGHIGPVAGASYDDRLYICSVAHGWRGHLERQRWRRVCIRWDSRDELRHRTR